MFETTAPDDAVARLSESMVRAGYTMTPRSAAYWRWRFLENPRRRYKLHVACRGDATVALAVSAHNGEVGELCDWVWDAGQGDDVARSVLLTLFTTVIDRFADAGATKARALAYDQVSEAVCARIGMRQRPTRAAYAIRAETAELERQLLDARWFVTLGDSDGD
jgi:hypothetical protein